MNNLNDFYRLRDSLLDKMSYNEEMMMFEPSMQNKIERGLLEEDYDALYEEVSKYTNVPFTLFTKAFTRNNKNYMEVKDYSVNKDDHNILVCTVQDCLRFIKGVENKTFNTDEEKQLIDLEALSNLKSPYYFQPSNSLINVMGPDLKLIVEDPEINDKINHNFKGKSI